MFHATVVYPRWYCFVWNGVYTQIIMWKSDLQKFLRNSLTFCIVKLQSSTMLFLELCCITWTIIIQYLKYVFIELGNEHYWYVIHHLLLLWLEFTSRLNAEKTTLLKRNKPLLFFALSLDPQTPTIKYIVHVNKNTLKRKVK